MIRRTDQGIPRCQRKKNLGHAGARDTIRSLPLIVLSGGVSRLHPNITIPAATKHIAERLAKDSSADCSLCFPTLALLPLDPCPLRTGE